MIEALRYPTGTLIVKTVNSLIKQYHLYKINSSMIRGKYGKNRNK